MVDCVLPMQVFGVWSLVRELRSHVPCSMAKKPQNVEKHTNLNIYSLAPEKNEIKQTKPDNLWQIDAIYFFLLISNLSETNLLNR